VHPQRTAAARKSCHASKHASHDADREAVQATGCSKNAPSSVGCTQHEPRGSPECVARLWELRLVERLREVEAVSYKRGAALLEKDAALREATERFRLLEEKVERFRSEQVALQLSLLPRKQHRRIRKAPPMVGTLVTGSCNTDASVSDGSGAMEQPAVLSEPMERAPGPATSPLSTPPVPSDLGNGPSRLQPTTRTHPKTRSNVVAGTIKNRLGNNVVDAPPASAYNCCVHAAHPNQPLPNA
jgi:hypothetical protein